MQLILIVVWLPEQDKSEIGENISSRISTVRNSIVGSVITRMNNVRVHFYY